MSESSKALMFKFAGGSFEGSLKFLNNFRALFFSSMPFQLFKRLRGEATPPAFS